MDIIPRRYYPIPMEARLAECAAIVFIGIACLFAWMACPHVYAAQSIEGQIGSEIEAIQEQSKIPTHTPAEPPPIGVEEPEEPVAEGVSEKAFFVKQIKLEGLQSLPLKDFQPLLAKLENKEVTLSKLQNFAKEITRFYRLKGFVTSRAFVPPQKITDQTVTIQILEGKFGKATVQGNRFFDTKWLLEYLTLKNGQVLKFDTIQEDVRLLNSNADRTVQMVLMPGQEPETTDILLNVRDRWPVHFSYSFDNSGTRLTGRLRQGAQFRHSNFLGRDDTLYTSVTISEHGDLVAESASYLYPISPSGGRITLSFSHSDLELGKDLRYLKVKGGANTFGIGYLHPLWEGTNWSVDMDSGFDIKEVWSTVDGQDNSRDHLRVIHFGPNVVWKDSTGTTSFANDFVFGIPSFLGGNVKVDSRSNRNGGGGQFFVMEPSVNRAQRFFFDTVLMGKFKAQITKYPLVSSQQFRAGGYDSVRGYGEGDSLGDYGFLDSTEWRVPPYFVPKDFKLPGTSKNVYDAVQFLAFADIAKTYLRRPSASQESSKLLIGVGGGFRIDFTDQVSGRFDWAWPIGDKPDDGAQLRLHFSFTVNTPNLQEIASGWVKR